jgi:hypothetical protein
MVWEGSPDDTAPDGLMTLLRDAAENLAFLGVFPGISEQCHQCHTVIKGYKKNFEGQKEGQGICTRYIVYICIVQKGLLERNDTVTHSTPRIACNERWFRLDKFPIWREIVRPTRSWMILGLCCFPRGRIHESDDGCSDVIGERRPSLDEVQEFSTCWGTCW